MDMKTKEEWATRMERILQSGDYPNLSFWIEKIQRDALQAAKGVCQGSHYPEESCSVASADYQEGYNMACEQCADQIDELMPEGEKGAGDE